MHTSLCQLKKGGNKDLINLRGQVVNAYPFISSATPLPPDLLQFPIITLKNAPSLEDGRFQDRLNGCRTSKRDQSTSYIANHHAGTWQKETGAAKEHPCFNIHAIEDCDSDTNNYTRALIIHKWHFRHVVSGVAFHNHAIGLQNVALGTWMNRRLAKGQQCNATSTKNAIQFYLLPTVHHRANIN